MDADQIGYLEQFTDHLAGVLAEQINPRLKTVGEGKDKVGQIFDSTDDMNFIGKYYEPKPEVEDSTMELNGVDTEIPWSTHNAIDARSIMGLLSLDKFEAEYEAVKAEKFSTYNVLDVEKVKAIAHDRVVKMVQALIKQFGKLASQEVEKQYGVILSFGKTSGGFGFIGYYEKDPKSSEPSELICGNATKIAEVDNAKMKRVTRINQIDGIDVARSMEIMAKSDYTEQYAETTRTARTNLAEISKPVKHIRDSMLILKDSLRLRLEAGESKA